MWDDEQKQRFRALRSRKLTDELNEAEQVELARMIRALEEEEAAYLRPATQRLEERNRQKAAQNAALKTLVEREKRLNRYLRKVLQKVDSERQAITNELAKIMEASSASGTGR